MNQSRHQPKTCCWLKVLVNVCEPLAICFCFTSHWITKWHEYFLNQWLSVETQQMWITLDTQMKTASSLATYLNTLWSPYWVYSRCNRHRSSYRVYWRISADSCLIRCTHQYLLGWEISDQVCLFSSSKRKITAIMQWLSTAPCKCGWDAIL